MGPVGAVAPIGFFFYIKILEVLTTVASIENLKKKLQLKVLNRYIFLLDIALIEVKFSLCHWLV